MAKRERKPVHHVQMTDGKRAIIQQLLQEYDIQDALKDLLGGTIKEMMEAEMEHHLGYEKSERTDSLDEVRDYRNGYKTKQVNSSFGSMDIEVPQDCLSEFEPQVVKNSTFFKHPFLMLGIPFFRIPFSLVLIWSEDFSVLVFISNNR